MLPHTQFFSSKNYSSIHSEAYLIGFQNVTAEWFARLPLHKPSTNPSQGVKLDFLAFYIIYCLQTLRSPHISIILQQETTNYQYETPFFLLFVCALRQFCNVFFGADAAESAAAVCVARQRGDLGARPHQPARRSYVDAR